MQYIYIKNARRFQVRNSRLNINLLILLFILIVLPSVARADWLDPGWSSRGVITVTNPGGVSLTGFQVKIPLNSTFDFSRSKNDGSDIRLTSADGITPVPFWIESWNSAEKTGILWAKVPSISPTGTALFLYYGNPSAVSISNGSAVFEFFDDFESNGTTTLGYYQLNFPQTELVRDQAWEATAPHSLSVVEVNSGGYTYWGYYGLQDGCGGVGLARSNDLINWTKYSLNPLFSNGRWPSVLKVDKTFYMLYTKDFCATSYIILAESTDGIAFSDVKQIVLPQTGYRNQNPNLFFNPNDGQYYLYWYNGNDSNNFIIKARKAPTPEGLDNPATETIVLQSSNTLAAPNMLFRDGTYFLSTESKDSSGNWIVDIYSSTSPTSGFSMLPGNPIIPDGAACNFQHVFGTQLHDYYCKQTGGVWTLDHQVADLTAGRVNEPSGDLSKWAASGGTWNIVSDIQQDGSVGGVAQGSISNTRDILLSSYTGTDYVLEGYGRLLSGRVWGFGTRATDKNNLYSSNLYEDLDGTYNLYEYDWAGGRASTLALAGVGQIDLDSWYKLTVKAHGNTIEVFKDDVLMINPTSSQYASGAVALYGERNTVAQFNNVLVRKYAATEPVATITQSTVITSLSPSSATAGGPAFTLTVNGGNFTVNSVVQWNGSARTTTFLSGSQLQASISAADIANSGIVGVSVFDPNSSGLSNTVTFTVQGPALQPVLVSLAPSSATAGGPAFTLTVNGSNFTGSSVVQWNGSARTTTFLSGSQLQASISATDIASSGNVPVTVFTPSPGGGTSNSISFGIVNTVPLLVSLTPSSATAGNSAFTLTVNGGNFTVNSVVQWNGSARTTTFLSGSQLQASISAADIANSGIVGVSVFDPNSSGLSNTVTFTVQGPALQPVLVSLAPSSATAGGPAFTLTVNGSNFTGSSVVQWNGSARTTTFLSGSQLQASISVTDIVSAGNVPVTVFTPSPGGGTSNSISFVVAPQPGQIGWLDPAWSSRKLVTITNPGGVTLSNFQVWVTLDSSFDFASVKSDGSDIRFTMDDGITPVSFWIESWNSTNRTALIWVNIPSIPSAGTSLYLYYGNPGAVTAANGSATFDFFDDFEGTALDTSRWTASGGTWSIVSDVQQDGSVGGVAQGSISNTLDILRSSYTGTDYVLEAYGRLLSGRVWGLGTRATDKNNLYSSNLYADLDSAYNLYEYGWSGGRASTLALAGVGQIDLDSWYILTVKVHGNTIEVLKDGVSMINTTSALYASGAVALYGERNTVAQFNNVLVRKYAAVEPQATIAP